ncbi:MAG: hypothetical protein QOH93_2264 [Chloroflexia bacterium]|jgi:hypothetical protein|nr:hypothetical protein [Chloroflexia bacterium]
MPNKAATREIPSRPEVSEELISGTITAQKPGVVLLLSGPVICTHMHSITGDFGMMMRLLPEYTGGHPQHGYMLDVCKTCLKVLPERPYAGGGYRKGHFVQHPAV